MVRSICSFLLMVVATVAYAATAIAAPQAAVATAHPMATSAGIDVLRQGGNAFDAAIAVTAALGVVEPFGSGLGGGGFWLLHFAEDGRQIVIDGRETAPAAARPGLYLGTDGNPIAERSRNGPLAAAIPGVPAALDHLSKHYACLPLSQTLKSAIEYARTGFPVTERYRRLAGYRQEVLQQQKSSAKIFLHQGKVPEQGSTIIQEHLADTLELIASRGAAAFYTGSLAVKMVRTVRSAGGVWRISDLAAYRIREREPIAFTYKDMRVVSVPPPSAGGVLMAIAMGILEQLGEQEVARDPEHYIVEAMRRAWQVRARYLGDPDFNDIPVQQLLDEDHIKQLAATIKPEATPSEAYKGARPLGEHTTHFSIVDFHGNRVAATLSINLPFGSGFVVADTGVLLNDEMDDFSMRELAPNAYGLISQKANLVAAGQRPLSSMSPTFLERGERVAVLGTPGGSRIISMVLLAALQFDAGVGPHALVTNPRYHHQFLPDEIQHEPGAFSAEQRRRLESLGHSLRDVGRKYGNMHAIELNGENMVAASDPRGEGEAVVIYAPPSMVSACQR
ncbi:MAG: gamma-glutamyltransferase [Candidatus Porifericomitaceae bacterium WSBS_2022_MAG_OTU9]